MSRHAQEQTARAAAMLGAIALASPEDTSPLVRDFEPLVLEIPNDSLLPALTSVAKPIGPGQNGGYPLKGLRDALPDYRRDMVRAFRFARKITAAAKALREKRPARILIDNRLEAQRCRMLFQGGEAPAVQPDGVPVSVAALEATALAGAALAHIVDAYEAMLADEQAAQATREADAKAAAALDASDAAELADLAAAAGVAVTTDAPKPPTAPAAPALEVVQP